MTLKQRRPGGQTGAGGAIGEIRQSIARNADSLPTVAGLVYGPCRGRSQYLILVRRCPFCAGGHRRYVVTAQVDRDTRRRGVRRHG